MEENSVSGENVKKHNLAGYQKDKEGQSKWGQVGQTSGMLPPSKPSPSLPNHKAPVRNKSGFRSIYDECINRDRRQKSSTQAPPKSPGTLYYQVLGKYIGKFYKKMKLFKKTKVENAEAEEDQEVEEPEAENSAAKTGPKRGMSVVDFIMRIIAALGTLGSAIAMRNTNGSLPFFTEFFHFRAKYDDLPTFTFFVVANAIASCYLLLSLVLSIFHIVKTGARITRAILIILDTVMLAFLMSGASAAAAIVHLAHRGNPRVNWAAICHQYNSFCERVSGSLVGSFIGILLLLLLVIFSAIALSRN